MKQFECSFEKEVMTAVRSHQWTDSLRGHAASCPVCSETMQVAALMYSYSGGYAPRAFPGHLQIWLKAEYAHKQEKLSTFDIITLIGMWLIGVLGLFGVIRWRFPQMFIGIVDLAGRSVPDFKNVLSNGEPFVVIIGLLVMAWVFTRDSFFAER